jgi:hypothetical protein
VRLAAWVLFGQIGVALDPSAVMMALYPARRVLPSLPGGDPAIAAHAFIHILIGLRRSAPPSAPRVAAAGRRSPRPAIARIRHRIDTLEHGSPHRETIPKNPGSGIQPGGAMEIVHVTDTDELAAEDQKFCEATKAWFKIDFVPKMSRVLLTVPEFGRPYGRASRRAMSDGALTRAQKELIATMVSAINVCEY